MNNLEREAAIRNCIKVAQSEGIEIAQSSWGIQFDYKQNEWKHAKKQACCGLATLLLFSQSLEKHITDYRSFHIEHILQSDSNWRESFQRGWDNSEFKEEFDKEAFEIGAKLSFELAA